MRKGNEVAVMGQRRFYRPDEVAQLLQLSRRTVYRLIRDGRLAGVKWGKGPWRIPAEIVKGLVPQQAVKNQGGHYGKRHRDGEDRPGGQKGNGGPAGGV